MSEGATFEPTLTEPAQSRAGAIALECVRALYRQIPNSFVAAMGVTLYMTVTMWNKAPPSMIAWWLGLQAVAQLHRFGVFFTYRRAEKSARVTAASARFWADQYTYYMAGAGVVWALAAFFFFRPESPLSQALTMCGLYGISGGAVPGNAYHPPAIRIFLLIIFGSVMVRMLMLGGVDYIVLGVASLFFMLIMMLFCRVQNRTILDSLRIRFENAELVERLRIQTAAADAARHRAEQANLAKSQFLAAASHDLRQPLHALGLFSASLKELELDDDQARVVERIYQNIDSLESLFDSLLDVSKLDAGYIKPQLVDFNVDEVLARTLARYQALADEKGIRLILAKATRGAVARSDPALCERILGNLVANAIRYTEKGGVLVACRARGGRLSIEVRDTGIGIPKAELSRIFDEFYQVGNPERDRRKGLGLGLAIARRTAELLESSLEVSSIAGRGSVFRFDLAPGELARVASPAQTAASEPEADTLAGRVILVIDDESTIREGMHDLLTRWGCMPIVAADGDKAMADLGPRVPDLMIADMRLKSGASGSDEIARLRARYGPVPGLIITGDTAPERLVEAKQGGLHILHKPVRPAQLRALANFLLTRA